jgi:hypothetical protein
VSQGTVEDVRGAHRILCFGATGSGKSMMAAALAEILGLPLTLVDDLCWGRGWVQTPIELQDARIVPVLESDAFVIDSVYRRHNVIALANVDVVVALDYPRLVSLARLVRRTTRRIRTRELVCNGNVETLGRAIRSCGALPVVAQQARAHARLARGCRPSPGAVAAPPARGRRAA